MESFGVYARIINDQSVAQASVALQDWGAVNTTGTSAHGLYALNAGTGLASLTVQPGTSVAVSGAQAAGHLAIDYHGLLTGFVDLAPGGQNVLTNRASGVVGIRHFADSDGDGARDIKRVAVSDFGAPTSRFVNMAGATVRLAPWTAHSTLTRSTITYQPQA